MQTIPDSPDEFPTVRVRTEAEDLPIQMHEDPVGFEAEQHKDSTDAFSPPMNTEAAPLLHDPEEKVFTLPFETANERLHSVASGLNELNCQMFGTAGSTIAKELCCQAVKYGQINGMQTGHAINQARTRLDQNSVQLEMHEWSISMIVRRRQRRGATKSGKTIHVQSQGSNGKLDLRPNKTWEGKRQADNLVPTRYVI